MQKIGAQQFYEIYIQTPLEECEKRDPKGLYKKARSGNLQNFTGIDSPYEIPSNANLVIDTSSEGTDDAVENILNLLRVNGHIA